ncbi:MAG: tetratricopeptide repeat protein, partial [Betaproteobacteria bacterium]
MSRNSDKLKNNALVTNKQITKKHGDLANLFQHGVSIHQQGRTTEASAIYRHVLAFHPEHVDTLYLLGVAEFQLGNHQAAVNLYHKVIKIKPDHMMAYNNLGIVLGMGSRWQEALAIYEKAIQANSGFAITFYNKGQALIEIRQYEAAISTFDKALALHADFAEAFLNRAFAHYSLKNYESALLDLNQAIRIQPKNPKALNIRGLCLYGLHRINEALKDFDSAIHLEPNLAEAWYNRGNVLNDLKRFDDSLESFDKALAIQPETDFLLGTWIHSKMMVGDWKGFEDNLELLTYRISQNKKSSASFAVLTLSDSLEVQRKAAEIWVREKFPFNPVLGPIKKLAKKDKIRIGYFSPDFRNHPMAQWVAELFELHNKNKFEIFGFYFGPPTADAMHQRIAGAFTNFLDVSDKNDQEIALLSRELGIDIAIDLAGFTEFSRTGIFAYRAAPLQVNYIGYPGTMGAEYIDYI